MNVKILENTRYNFLHSIRTGDKDETQTTTTSIAWTALPIIFDHCTNGANIYQAFSNWIQNMRNMIWSCLNGPTQARHFWQGTETLQSEILPNIGIWRWRSKNWLDSKIQPGFSNNEMNRFQCYDSKTSRIKLVKKNIIFPEQSKPVQTKKIIDLQIFGYTSHLRYLTMWHSFPNLWVTTSLRKGT